MIEFVGGEMDYVQLAPVSGPQPEKHQVLFFLTAARVTQAMHSEMHYLDSAAQVEQVPNAQPREK